MQATSWGSSPTNAGAPNSDLPPAASTNCYTASGDGAFWAVREARSTLHAAAGASNSAPAWQLAAGLPWASSLACSGSDLPLAALRCAALSLLSLLCLRRAVPQVDLGSVAQLSTVVFGSGGISTATVSTSQDLKTWADCATAGSDPVTSVACNATGRYLRIKDSSLNLCTVQIYPAAEQAARRSCPRQGQPG